MSNEFDNQLIKQTRTELISALIKFLELREDSLTGKEQKTLRLMKRQRLVTIGKNEFAWLKITALTVD